VGDTETGRGGEAPQPPISPSPILPFFRFTKNPRRLTRRTGFTLFELILAVALSVTLVALIGTAINLYLSRVDASRSNVEEAQLARSILAMIADDIRAATIYQPQDLSALAAMAASGEFDVDSIDEERGGGDDDGPSGGQSGGGSSFGTGGGMSSGGGSGGMSSGGASNMSGGSSGGTSGGGGSPPPESTMPLGLNGSFQELYVDATRLPRQEELFNTVTGYTNAPMGIAAGGLAASSTVAAASGVARPSDLKSVRYFIRPGEAVQRGSVATTSLDPAMQLRAGGLVRQEIPRAARVWAEQSGSSTVLESGQQLLAPEVVHIEFRYFDGTQVVDIWDMQERNCLPMAVEIRLWLAPVGEDASVTQYSSANLANANQYRQTVYLPMSQVASSKSSGMSGSGGASGMSGSSSFGSSSGSMGSQSSSGFNEP
jgi:hypothetical protein